MFNLKSKKKQSPSIEETNAFQIVDDLDWLRRWDQEWQGIMKQLRDVEKAKWNADQRRLIQKLTAIDYKILSRPQVLVARRAPARKSYDNSTAGLCLAVLFGVVSFGVSSH